MIVSVFTPTHDIRNLDRLRRSLDRQTAKNFEWIIVPNNGAIGQIERFDVPSYARVIPYRLSGNSVGAFKLFACQQASGDVLVEMDHDDELTPDAIETVSRTFADGRVDFAYSNFAQFKDGKPIPFQERFGWQNRPFEWNGRAGTEIVGFSPTPATFSRIWYGPNHLRAWKRSFYDSIGGHDPVRDVLDDQDLFCRSFIAGNVEWIDRCLYVYHLHDQNTFAGDRNKRIQVETLELHDQYIEPMLLRWSRDRGLRRLDLCGGINGRPGYETVDRRNADVCCDLDERWPIADGSVGVIRAQDALEHLRDPIHTMREIFRVLADDGFLLSRTPSTDGRGAFQDPTHVSFWNQNSFWYYTRRDQNRFIDCPVRFQAVRLLTEFPNDWAKENQIAYVRADLLKIGNQRVAGAVEI